MSDVAIHDITDAAVTIAFIIAMICIAVAALR